MKIKKDSIIIIDDDTDDLEIIKNVLESMHVPNDVHYFDDSIKALQFLQDFTAKIFFILCDINMPKLDGLILREKINEEESLRLKAIPFLFFSTSGDGQIVKRAYALNIQGYFKKPNSPAEYKEIFADIMNYWSRSELP